VNLKNFTSILLAIFTVFKVIAQDSQSETGQLYDLWIRSYADNNPQDNRPYEQDPIFLKLIQKKDAEPYLLRGLHHSKQGICELSRIGLSRFQTDQRFASLVEELHSTDMFVRERSLEALSEFRQSRCIDHILKILKNDPKTQLRRDAAYQLSLYDTKEVRQALLKTLKDDNAVAASAATTLGKFNEEKAITPTYNLILNIKDRGNREAAFDALRWHKNKKIIPLFFDLMERFQGAGSWGEYVLERLDGDLVAYSKMTSNRTTPDTLEQWRDWWQKAESLFDDTMNLKPISTQRKEYKTEEFGENVHNLVLEANTDSQSYRPGEPIRLDISFSNKSDQPYRVVLPYLPSRWWGTMAYGIYLKRIKQQPAVILSKDPSADYMGSYSGPPGFSTLSPHEIFKDSISFDYWIVGSKIWPLPEGEYELTIAFDSSKFAFIKASKPELLGLWTTKPIRFSVSGKPLTKPDELLGAIGIKTGMPWLRTDLTSRRGDRKDEAWRCLHEYGDSRLQPFLQTTLKESELSANRYGSLRPFAGFSGKDSKTENP
jgi:hypothetical protein